MTDAEWLAGEDPMRMLQRFRGELTDRKCRLFACACCRRIWHLLPHEASRATVEAAERFADGLIEVAELRAAWEAALEVSQSYGNQWVAAHGGDEEARRVAQIWQSAASAACYASHPNGNNLANHFAGARGTAEAAAFAAALHVAPQDWREERARQRKANVSLLRDIVGNPFRPVSLGPAWRTENVVVLARTIYDERAFERMPILADALMDAGCDNEEILAHCRGPGPHVRGCWVIDLILGKG